jgi:hypothetical protein
MATTSPDGGLDTGDSFGNYETICAIGEGGMGSLPCGTDTSSAPRSGFEGAQARDGKRGDMAAFRI